MDRLVKYLSTGTQNVCFEPQTKCLEELIERIFKLKFVFVKFTDTQGETELGIDIDNRITNLTEEAVRRGVGNIKIVGTCELNYHKVRCHADIDLSTRKGVGYLELVK